MQGCTLVTCSHQMPPSARSVSQSAPTLRAVRTTAPEGHNAAGRSAKAALRPFQPNSCLLPQSRDGAIQTAAHNQRRPCSAGPVRDITKGTGPIVTGASGSPTEGRTTTEVLASFDSDAAEVANAVAQGKYLLWLGSGISRSVVPDIEALLTKLLRFLHERIDTADEACRFTRAVHDIFGVPPIPHEVRDAIDLSGPAAEWPLDDLVTRLSPHYSLFWT